MKKYAAYLMESGLALNTVKKYLRDAEAFLNFASGREATAELLEEYKAFLLGKYPVSSVRSMTFAVNKYLCYSGSTARFSFFDLPEIVEKSDREELSGEEYTRILNAARTVGDERLRMLIETICSAGLQVSELQYITVKAVEEGQVFLPCGKSIRAVYLPKKLCIGLRQYCAQNSIMSGPIFVTRSGKPLDRSNIWRDMKKLCDMANVEAEKVFPQKFKKLYARTFDGLKCETVDRMDLAGCE